MDELLSIRQYGSPPKSWNMTLEIEGKELLADALIDFFGADTKVEQIKILESLKSKIYDWVTIDEKIESIDLSTKNINQYNKNINLLSHYDNDDNFRLIVTERLSNLNDTDEINRRLESVEYIINEDNNMKGINILKEVLQNKLK